MSVIVTSMARAGTQPLAEWHEEYLADPENRAQWYAGALAHALTLAIVRYRNEHGLTQTALGKRIGMPQAQISRIEAGGHTPSLDTLLRLADALGLEIDLSIRPRSEDRRPAPRARNGAIVETTDQLIVAIRPAG